MTVPFTQVPQTLRLPFVFAEVDNTKANLAQVQQRSLIIGQMTSAGTLAANVPALMQGTAWLRGGSGPGSMLALMGQQYRNRDRFGEVWVLPLSDDGAATAATGSIAINQAATAAGVRSYYIGGQRLQLPVTASQTAAQIATALAAAINAATDLPVTAAVDGTVTTKVNLTAKNKGLAGNEIDLRVNYLGALGGEVTPAGFADTITAMSGGATNPSLTTALANLTDQPFDFICMPYTDTASLNALQSFLATRWAWNRMLYGGAFAAYRGTVGGLTTFGTTRNDPHVAVMGFNDSPDPAWIWAADITAACAESLRADPALPLQTVALNVKAPPVTSRFAMEDRDVLLHDGIATFTVDNAGQVRIERMVTTYQTNAAGQPDDSYLDVERLYTLAFALRDIRSFIQTKYARVKIADDGQRVAPGAAVVTPAVIRADIIGRYRFNEQRGFVQDTETFKQRLVVERNASNRSRVDVLWPIVPIDQLRQVALLAQFRQSGGQE